MLAFNGLTPEADARRRQIERERHQNGRTSPAIRITSGAMPSLESITHILTQPRDYDIHDSPMSLLMNMKQGKMNEDYKQGKYI